MADAAWKQFLSFEEKHNNDDACDHQQCLDALKAAIREALRMSLHPKKSQTNAEDARSSLLLIERTLKGQTCSFGNYIFNFRQGCIVLLNLLKLLPEPSFENVAQDLASMAAQLVEQLGRQDFSLLRSFINDSVSALMNARERPFTTMAFPKFVQRCKVAVSEETPGSTAKAGTAGLPLELSTSLRMSTFCSRLLKLTIIIVRALAPFTSLVDLEQLWGVAQGLASDVVTWSEQAAFDTADSVRMVVAFLDAFRALLLDGSAPECLRVTSLHVQAGVLDEFPHIAAFAMRECDDEAREALVDLAAKLVTTFDETLLFPCLPEVLSPFWPCESRPSSCLHVFLAAGARFGGINVPGEELWRRFAVGQAPVAVASSAGGGGDAGTLAALEPKSHALLAAALQRLRAHVPICTYAVSRAKEPRAPGADALQQTVLLALAVRTLPASEIKTVGQLPSCNSALARFTDDARMLIRKQLPVHPGVHSQALRIVLETLLEHPWCTLKLETDGNTFLAGLMQAVSTGKAPTFAWELVLLALQVFVVHSKTTLEAKFKCLQKLLSRSQATPSKQPPCVLAAGWVALGHTLLYYLKRRRAPPEASAKAQGDSEALVYKQVLELLVQYLGSGNLPHQSVLVAMAYLFPLLTAFSYMLPGLSDRGEVLRMPYIPEVFMESKQSYADMLRSLNSPCRSVPNPLRTRPAFDQCVLASDEIAAHGVQVPAVHGGGGSSLEADHISSTIVLPALCPFCDTPPPKSPHLDSDCCQTDLQQARTCQKCGMELLTLEWAEAFVQGGSRHAFSMPLTWGRLRHPDVDASSKDIRWSQANTCCWVKTTSQLMGVFSRLCRSLLQAEENATAKWAGLLEPGESQDLATTAAAGGTNHARSGSQEVMWLLRCGLLGLCVSASSEQLHAQKASITDNLRRLLPKPTQIALTWERNSIPNVLLNLVQSNSFVSAMLQLGNPHDLGWHKNSVSLEAQRDRLGSVQRSAQWKCNHWRLELFGVAACSPWKELLERPSSLLGLPDGASPSADRVALQPGLLPPRLFSAAFAGAPRAAMASALALLISAVAAPRSKTQTADVVAASLCLQQLFAVAMLVRHSFEDLFAYLQGDMYLRLFERYSKSTHRAGNLCQLVLRGPLDTQVRALLPKILPAMVLAKKMQTIQDLCALLEESVQSLFTPQLPYILSAIAQQPVQHVAGSFMFILQRVYHNQMTIANICDASLGQVLVLILWNSAGASDSTEARSQAFSAVDNIVSALKTHQPNGAASVGSKRPGNAPTPGGSGAIAGGPAARKRRLADKGGDAAVVEVAADGPSPEVVQTLEGSFLHVLDILEIVLTGNRQSPKWAEYSSLLNAQCDSDAVDQGRLLAAIALLFELVPESLHKFAPKVLEFLQSATAGSEYLDESIRCWQQFVNFVGVQRLKPLIPAVVGELLQIAEQLKRQNPVSCQQFCDSFFSGVIDSSCKQHPDVVVLLPALPQWSELRAARAALEKAVGPQKQNTFVERLKVGLQQLENTTQQAVRRAALDHIRDLVAVQRAISPADVSELNTTLLAKLMRALFKFLWESSAWPDDQLKCGQLLGAIGAVDPSRFSRVDLGEAKARIPQDLGSSELLAKRVLAEFLVPNLTSKNAYAFAVQEILKYLQSRGKADKILKDLREDVRETLRPYLSSSYQLIEGAQLLSDTSSFEGVVAQAASLVQGDQRTLFEACLPAVHGNHALALFLMHHVLHHLLTSNTGLGELGKLSAALAGLLESPKHATAQAVFTLVDDMIQRQEQLQSEVPVASKPGDATIRNRQLQRIEQMRRPITSRKVVAASVRCGAHARALQFLEEAIIDEAQSRTVNPFDNPCIQSEDDCFLLQSIYSNLDEPDGVLGALRVGPATVRMRMLQSKHAGRWQDVQACYEEQLSLQAASGGQSSRAFERQELLCGLVQCEQNMRRFESSLRLIQGMDGEDMQTRLRPHAVEAAWQLSSWDRLQQALDMPSAHDSAGDFQVKLGQALLAFHEQEGGLMQSVLKETTLQVTRTLASAARESYARAYEHLLKLHVLSDISWLAETRDASVSKGKSGGTELRAAAPSQIILGRLEATAPTFHTRQLILSTTRVALTDMALTDDAKQIELASVRLCRKHNVPISMEHPSISFAQVSPELASRAQLEWGRLLYARGSRHDALQHMQQLALSHPKARLLGTRWATEAASELLIPKVAEAEFKEAREKLPEYEASWFYHASYLDQLLKEQLTSKKDQLAGNAAREAQRLRRNHSSSSVCPFDLKNLVTFTVRGYLQALHRGNKRLHFILNRVLQLVWECCELDIHKTEALAEVDRQARDMQPWMWYVVLPQLISRVHNPDMRQVFTKLIMSALVAFPHQAGWQMVQLLKSSDKEHQKLGKDMLLEVGRSRNDVHRTMVMYYHVCADLNTLATYNPPQNDTTMTLDKVFPKLVGSFQKPSDAWRVLVPLQSQMTAVFPMTRVRQDRGVFNPFPEMICTDRCLEQVDVFRTKERPKKLTFRGNDGKNYSFLCKAERRGDLRKDARMMQFGTMVNQLMQRNPDARRRNLEVQTFNVVIFAESCGLIEWVPNTRGVRHIIDDLWRRARPGTQQSLREIKELFDRSKDLYETFTKQVLPRHPPMLHRWFSQKADPSVWFSRRLLYSRSQALWCMLGYILGLGDRHGENILLDTESGRVVHVDFDCLFGKGMLLERPETVPFRLTQNCVSALGITGVEGVFRKSCELCMEVLRDRANQQTLLSVLHVFIADPLIEWTSKPQKAQLQDGEEPRGIQQARSTIGDVERKLNGMLNVGAVVKLRAPDKESVLSPEERGKGLLGRDRGVGLSVAGQVDELLKAAMCKRNLSEMYVGWQPWL